MEYDPDKYSDILEEVAFLAKRPPFVVSEIRNYTLPWPPTVNTYWRHTKRGIHYVSKRGVQFRQDVAAAVGKVKPLSERIAVRIVMCKPESGRWMDIDNGLKAILDALQHAGVYENDSQIDELSVRKGDPKDDGVVFVQVAVLSNSLQLSLRRI